MNHLMNYYLNEEEQTFLNQHYKTQEELDLFIKTYMYVLNVGSADGIVESVMESYSFNNGEKQILNEGLLGNVISFFKGKNAISKYYKGLDAAAKAFIQSSKKIDTLELDQRADKRKVVKDSYDNAIKDLDAVKKEIDALKQESSILTTYDNFAMKKYQLKLFLTGRKSGVNIAKLKGYSDKIESIKKEIEESKNKIKSAEEEAKDEKEKKAQEEADKKAKEDADKQATTDEKTPTDKETRKKEAQAKMEEIKQKASETAKMLTNKIQEKAPKEEIDALKAEREKIKQEVAKLEKIIKENQMLSLSFFTQYNSLNEQLICLERLIEENL